MQSDATTRKLEIKKYPNRRYYDSTHSRHLLLDEIRSLIQQGYDISATDARTGEDITAQLLTQIILELETAKLDSFPVPLLVRLIRMNDQGVKDFIEQYFNQALKSFLDYQRQIGEQIVKAQGVPASFPSVTAWTEAMLKPFAAAFSPAGWRASSKTVATPAQTRGNRGFAGNDQTIFKSRSGSEKGAAKDQDQKSRGPAKSIIAAFQKQEGIGTRRPLQKPFLDSVLAILFLPAARIYEYYCAFAQLFIDIHLNLRLSCSVADRCQYRKTICQIQTWAKWEAKEQQASERGMAARNTGNRVARNPRGFSDSWHCGQPTFPLPAPKDGRGKDQAAPRQPVITPR